MSADRKFRGENGILYSGSKIIRGEKMACSFWGWKCYKNKSGEIIDLEKSLKDILKEDSEIDKIAKIICDFLNENKIEKNEENKNMGVHLSGFSKNRPTIFHIFWLNKQKKFVLEHSNLECYDIDENHHNYKDDRLYFPLFNGVSQIAKLRLEKPELFKGEEKDYSKVNFDEALEDAKKIIFITSQFCKDWCGMGMNYLKITPENISDIYLIKEDEMNENCKLTVWYPSQEIMTQEIEKFQETIVTPSGNDPIY